MNTLFMALLLTLPTGQSPVVAATQTTPVTPHHYISTIGFESVAAELLPSSILTWPAVQHNVSQGFSAGHSALDIFAKLGQPVVAMSDGIVTEITTAGSYGNKIVISHPYLSNNTETLYAHLDRMNVQVGQSVVSGQQIGTIGLTGNSTGPHLHFEVHQNGVSVNPLSLF